MAALPFQDIDAEIFDDHVGKQLLAHGFDFDFGFFGIGFAQFQFDELALADVIDAVEAKRAKRVLYGLALRVENALFEGDVDFCFQRLIPLLDGFRAGQVAGATFGQNP